MRARAGSASRFVRFSRIIRPAPSQTRCSSKVSVSTGSAEGPSKPTPTMAVSGVFLLGYGVFRTAIEFVRVPDDGIYFAWGWLTKGQLFSAPMILAGIVLLILAYRRGGATTPASA